MTNREIAQITSDTFHQRILEASHDYTRKGSVTHMKLLTAKNTTLRALGFMDGKHGKVVKFKPAK